jgi:LysR family transcriptional regulator, regulator for bpeEF and oprC
VVYFRIFSIVWRCRIAATILNSSPHCGQKRLGKPKTLQDLQNGRHTAVNFFSAKTGRVFPFDFSKGSSPELRFGLPHLVAANDANTPIELICAGLGVAQIPSTQHTKNLLKEKRLQRVLRQWNAASLPLYIMCLRNRHLSARLRAIADWTVDLYQKQFKAKV